MLTSLLIRNFALIDDLRIDFGAGLTTMTGETGAGKSIVIDALGLALGERADTTMIRDGADKAVIEAEFALDGDAHVREHVQELGAEWQPVLILRREVLARGTSRCYVNDSPVTVGALKELGDRLVDIHGQHEHQSLLRAEAHLGILDALGGLAPLVSEYAYRLEGFLSALSELEKARRNRDAIDERRLVISHQLQELSALDPHPDEDTTVERELRIAEQGERISTLIAQVLDVLYDGEHCVVDALGRTNRVLAELGGIDASLVPLAAEIDAAHADVADVVRTLRAYAERVEYSPERCEELRHRLAELTAMKRKHRCTMEELVRRRTDLADELASLENIDERIAALEKRVQTARDFTAAQAVKLSEARHKAAKQLARSVVRELRELGLPDTRFDTMITPRAHSASDGRHLVIDGAHVAAMESGCDEVEFYITTNVGEDLKPLARVVSGGEVSRIMLALKSIFAGSSHVPVMVFDEIDTGVSGNIARRVGMVMRRLASHHQIIAITHLPQIASVGSTHLKVEKRVIDKRTITNVRQLPLEDRAHEIARLLSADTVSDAALQSARELLIIE